jgi:putative pyruvate formate lyase activating enzyme
MEKEYDSCTLCPKNCGVNRNAGLRGFCGETDELRIAWAGLHFGEEPPITVKGGSGTIFITGCNLRCKFCQNFQISQDGMGKAVTTDDFAKICVALQNAGAENINIVTGSHAIPAIATGLRAAQDAGLAIPVLWNSSSYEHPEALELLDGLVTGWLPDLKTLNPILAENVFRAGDYPRAAKKAIRWMAEKYPLVIEHPDDEKYPAGKIVSGVIVRHLVLPGKLDDTRLVLAWFAEHLADNAVLSLMTQYTPVKASPHARGIDAFPDRTLLNKEYSQLEGMLEEYGIDTGFYQELVEDTDWLPDFNRTQPFSSKLARPIWHWTTGFITGENSLTQNQ